MPIIGESEAAVREADPDREPDQFILCGELFTVDDGDLTIPFARFAQASRDQSTGEGVMNGLAAMMDLLEAVVIEDDRKRFLDTAAKHRLDEEVLFDIVNAVMEAEAGRPTQQPAGSSSGRSTTGASSRGSSPSEAWLDSPFARRELAANPERFADVLPIELAARALAG